MTFAGELVKNATQAAARAVRYLADLDEEDDAITCAVRVPDWLVHAFVAGHRVEFKNTYMPGYQEDYVWLRVAAVTVRQINGPDGNATGIYDLALDLRAETPPGPLAPVYGPVPCPDDTPGLDAFDMYPLGNGTGGNAAVRPAPYVLQYFRAGLTGITVPGPVGTLPDDYNSWQFPVFGAGGVGHARLLRDGPRQRGAHRHRVGRRHPAYAFASHDTTFTWRLVYWNGATEITEQSGSIGMNGSMIPVTVPEDEHCHHILILENFATSGAPGRFNFEGAAWQPEIGPI